MPDRRSVLGGIGAAALLSPLSVRGQGLTTGFEAGRLEQGGWARGRTQPGATVRLDWQAVTCGADGRFFVAFDRDAAPAATLLVQLPGGVGVSQSLAIAPRRWQIEQVDAPFHPPELPDAAYVALRKVERARIDAARALVTGAQGWRQTFAWPARGRISGHFGAQRIYRGTPGSYHGGTDIAGPAGAAIVAPADGVVILAAEQPFTLEGRLLMVDHGAGLNSAFLHCSQLLVREGEPVRQGQEIARIGMTGRATGPHLHWGLRWQEARLDPELFVAGLPA
jgi:murein DD-endopeptidase MepM/ murein hydrolase activator NlpD